MWLRLIFLTVYIAVAVLVQRYLVKHPPEPTGQFVHYATRNFAVFFWLCVPLLMPIAAFLWMDASPLGLAYVVVLGFTLPVFVIVVWMRNRGMKLHLFFILFLVLIIGGTLLIGTVLQFVNNARAFDLSVLPLLFFILAPQIFLLQYLKYWAPQVLPYSDPNEMRPDEIRERKKNAIDILNGFLTGCPKPFVTIEKGIPVTRMKGNSCLGDGPGLVITEPNNAVAIRTGAALKRISGPGVVFTGVCEGVHAVVDLEKQFRPTKNNEVVTKDGITLRLPCSSIYGIKGARGPSKVGDPWPFHQNAAWRAVQAAEVNPQGKTPLEEHESGSWADMPVPLAIHKLKQVVQTYTLDEIYGAEGPKPQKLARQKIGKTVRDYVKSEMDPLGIEVVGGGVGNRVVPVNSEVVEQRVENWKAIHMQTIVKNESERGAEYVRQLGRVRGEVLSEMLTILKEQSDKLKDAPPEASAFLVMLRLLETLEGIARNPRLEPLLPERTKAAIEEYQRRAQSTAGGN
ncbi:MAG: hypothetical protein JXB35_00460 [Anaerolineae bacterium]|nr:hypothetical protein [Anaerolineae bacterium]